MEFTKNDLKLKIGYWSEAYIEVAKRFYNLEADAGKEEYEKFKQRVHDAKYKINALIERE